VGHQAPGGTCMEQQTSEPRHVHADRADADVLPDPDLPDPGGGVDLTDPADPCLYETASIDPAASRMTPLRYQDDPADERHWRARARLQRLKRWRDHLLIAAIDAVLIMASMVIAYWMRYRANWPSPFEQIVREVAAQNSVPPEKFLPFGLLLLVLLLGLFFMKGLYRLPRSARLFDHAAIIGSSATTGIAVLIVVVFLYHASAFYSRLIFAFAWLVIIFLLGVWRGLLIEWRRWRWIRGVARERVLVVGGTGLARSVMGSIVAQPFLGYALVGYLDDHAPPSTERRDGHFRYLGSILELRHISRVLLVDQVILALPFWEHHRLPELVAICREIGIEFRFAPDLHELSFDHVDVANLGGVPLIGLKELSLKGWNLVLKRAMDLTLVLLSAPLILLLGLLVSLAIRLDSPGAAIFRQQRVGKDGRLFTVYKFRTMVLDAESRKADLAALNEADGPLFKIRNDPRLTRIGRFLRRTSLDELPQFWNVLRGEMSLVGPRPPTPDEVARYESWHYRRLEVTPGLTGLWQVLGRSDTSFDEMVRLDIYYAENWTPGLDMRIILQTLPVVFSGAGAY